MLTVTVADAKTRLIELIDQLEHEEAIVLTRHGQAVARLVPEPRTKLAEHSISQPVPLEGDSMLGEFHVSEVGSLAPPR